MLYPLDIFCTIVYNIRKEKGGSRALKPLCHNGLKWGKEKEIYISRLPIYAGADERMLEALVRILKDAE